MTSNQYLISYFESVIILYNFLSTLSLFHPKLNALANNQIFIFPYYVLIISIILIRKTHKNLLVSNHKYIKNYIVHHESIRTFLKFENINTLCIIINIMHIMYSNLYYALCIIISKVYIPIAK